MPPGFIRRAISPLHFQPLHPDDPDDILCPGSDADESTEERRAKRRRVEDVAHEYLRGKTLYISSARLKGPFPRTWRNPYGGTQGRGANAERERSVISGRSVSKEQHRHTEAPRSSDRIDHVQPHEPTVRFSVPTPRSRHRSSPEHTEAITDHSAVQQDTEKDFGPPLQPPSVTTANEATEGAQHLALTKTHGSRNRDWLKTSSTFAKNRSRDKYRATSPTPTPAPMIRKESAKLPSTALSRDPIDQPASMESDSSEHLTARSDTNSANGDRLLAQPVCEEPQKAPSSQASSPESNPIVKEVDIEGLDSVNREAYDNVKLLSQQAVLRAQYDSEAYSEAKRLSQEAAQHAVEASAAAKEATSHLKRTGAASERPKAYAPCVQRSTHELPPSTNLPGFEYRKASHSPKRKSFREDLEAAKKKARAEEKRRISFTASGSVKGRRSQPSSRGSQAPLSSQSRSLLRLPQRGMTEGTSSEGDKESPGPEHLAAETSTSNQAEVFPEAQAVPSAGLSKGHSTDVLETEKQSLKFPSTDEGNSYLDLSTQAAMHKAQRSFDHDVASTPSPSGDSNSDHALSSNDGEGHVPMFSPKRGISTPAANDWETVSTQAMMDAMSPFAVTTVKRKPRSERSDSAGSASPSSPSSPTPQDFRATSLSMSTSPSHSPAPIDNEPPIALSALSKPISTITSFSIAPNGTMTEILQYDGQQRQNYQMGDSDLDTALEEAGSFLGDWSVEKEAKHLQRSTAESRAS